MEGGSSGEECYSGNLYQATEIQIPQAVASMSGSTTSNNNSVANHLLSRKRSKAIRRYSLTAEKSQSSMSSPSSTSNPLGSEDPSMSSLLRPVAHSLQAHEHMSEELNQERAFMENTRLYLSCEQLLTISDSDHESPAGSNPLYATGRASSPALPRKRSCSFYNSMWGDDSGSEYCSSSTHGHSPTPASLPAISSSHQVVCDHISDSSAASLPNCLVHEGCESPYGLISPKVHSLSVATVSTAPVSPGLPSFSWIPNIRRLSSRSCSITEPSSSRQLRQTSTFHKRPLLQKRSSMQTVPDIPSPPPAPCENMDTLEYPPFKKSRMYPLNGERECHQISSEDSVSRPSVLAIYPSSPPISSNPDSSSS